MKPSKPKPTEPQPPASPAPEFTVSSINCCKCGWAIVMGQGFVRIRADRTKADMVLAHDSCHPDPLLKRRVMNEKVLEVIQQYGA